MAPIEIVAADIGGTHARFAIAEVAGGRVVALGPETTLRTIDHASLASAWRAFGAGLGRELPRAAAIAVAGPVSGAVLKLTNNPWVIRPDAIDVDLGVDRSTIVNDFAAVAHAVAQVDASDLRHLCGPDAPLPRHGVVTIVGPGTGLGVAQLRIDGGDYVVTPTEGGHIEFAPLDGIEDAILARLRARYRRVSVERLVSGPGLANIHEALAAIEGRAIRTGDDKALWTAALAGDDPIAAGSLDRFCAILGTVAGDLALAQGAHAVVIAGGLGLRLADRLPRSGFGARFTAKGRFESMMARMPVRLITHPQPGLFGAAAAFARALPGDDR